MNNNNFAVFNIFFRKSILQIEAFVDETQIFVLTDWHCEPKRPAIYFQRIHEICHWNKYDINVKTKQKKERPVLFGVRAWLGFLDVCTRPGFSQPRPSCQRVGMRWVAFPFFFLFVSLYQLCCCWQIGFGAILVPSSITDNCNYGLSDSIPSRHRLGLAPPRSLPVRALRKRFPVHTCCNKWRENCQRKLRWK